MADEQVVIKVDLHIAGTLTLIRVPSPPPIPGSVVTVALRIDPPGPRQF